MQADITYIDHSGFLIELPEVGFLFDYYRGQIPVMDSSKPLVVFVSHRHQDHYNPVIFQLVKRYPEIYFVLAKGIPVKHQIAIYAEQGIDLESHLIFMKRNDDRQLTLGDRTLTVKTMKSTDEGVAFFITWEGKNFYYAGDLNQWVWEGESLPYNDNMRTAYLKEMQKLDGQKIDVAFVPLDPRLEEHTFEGMEVFLEHAQAEWVFPMHFWGDFGVIQKFLEKHGEWKGKLAEIQNAGQSFREKI